MGYLGNFTYNGSITGGNIVDGTIEGTDLSSSAIIDKLGYTPATPTSVVTAQSKADAGYNQANTATTAAATAQTKADAGYAQANTATTSAATAQSKANAGYNQANTATTSAATAQSKADAGYNQANTATTAAATAQAKADAAATPAYVDTSISNLVNSAPAALDTLNELASALGSDANFSTTVTNSLATKAPLASPTFTGTVSGITKSMVGLGSVDNTTDVNKPISTATQSALNGKAGTGHGHGVVTTLADGYMSSTDKSKLDGIAAGATAYTHPTNHPPSIITQDVSNRFVTDTEKTTWNAKSNSGHTHTFDSLTSKTVGTGTYTTSGDFRAPIFYDSNDTGYYVDPTSTSHLNVLNVDGKVGIGTSVPENSLTVMGSTIGAGGKVSFYGGGDENTQNAARNEVIRIGRSDILGSFYHSIWSSTGSGGAGSHWLRFYISGSDGVSQTLSMQMDGTGSTKLGNLYPHSDASYNLGSTSMRWANIYTADAHFSNEGTTGNIVDGTTGNWTLQEGENNIYMINNKTGKRFKIKLEEM